MSDLRIALVAEGPTDYVVIEAALKAVLDKSFILTQLQPEVTRPEMGGGWGGVLKWCYGTSKRHSGVLDHDPTLSNFDLIILHLDVDVSTFSYQHCGQEVITLSGQLNWANLPCARACPPASDSADALAVVLKSWLGPVSLGRGSVLCLPAQSSGTWLAAAVLASDDPLLQHAECDITLENRLGQLPKANRIKKTRRAYQTKASEITQQWQIVKSICPQALRFEQAVQAAL